MLTATSTGCTIYGCGAAFPTLTAGNNYSVVIGNNAGNISLSTGSVIIGYGAGQLSDEGVVAIGCNAGHISYENAVAIGCNAGNFLQGSSAVAIGTNAGNSGQGDQSIAIGNNAGQTGQGTASVAICNNAGNFFQGSNAVAIGNNAGYTAQANESIAIGFNAGQDSQETRAIAIGTWAGSSYQKSGSTCIGYRAGAAGTSQNGLYFTIQLLSARGVSVDFDTSSGQMGPVSSSERFKENIVDYTDDTSWIYNTSLKSFNYKTKPDIPEVGYIAEEINDILPTQELKDMIVVRDLENEIYSLKYQSLNLLMFEEMKKSRKELCEVKKELCELKQKLNISQF